MKRLLILAALLTLPACGTTLSHTTGSKTETLRVDECTMSLPARVDYVVNGERHSIYPDHALCESGPQVILVRSKAVPGVPMSHEVEARTIK